YQPRQVAAAETPVEGIYRGARQQIAGRAVAVEIDSTHGRAKRRRARVGKIKPQFEAPGQLRHTGQVRDLCEIRGQRPWILQPIVEIESGSSACPAPRGSRIARIRIRAEHLKAVGKALVGLDQQSLISLA